ncbi:MAG TPA: MFS transporter [Gemmatimonadales bacterium]|nr:MFS transporter [Gemmatimonadales bacterium]
MKTPLAGRLALDRNTGPVAAAVFLMAMGEELWKRFAPKYLESLGAPLVVIGAYGSTRDLLDGLAQYPGGWVVDRYGHRAGLRLFIVLAATGYVLLAAASSWAPAFAGVVLVMAWSSMASPALFAVIGEALPVGRRTLGFSVQSILRRLPIVVAPFLGGLLIARYGMHQGVRLGLVINIVLAVATLALVSRVRLALSGPSVRVTPAGVWRSLPRRLKWLLVSDILVRTCEGLVDVFLVLYALDVVGIRPPAYGLLIGVQMGASILGYLPGAWLAARIGSKPVVTATFVAFALFPIAVVSAESLAGLVGAFAVGGLREIGEPARKALIVDLAPPALRARSVGMYYLVRSLSIAPAASVGGLLWQAAPALPFYLAGGFGLLGAVVFAATADGGDVHPKPEPRGHRTE